MGNKPSFRIGLKLDSNDFVAGQVLEGRVYLSVDKKSQLEQVEGIHLRLEGWEQAVVRKDENGGGTQGRGAHAPSSGGVQTSTRTIVLLDYAIVKVKEIKVGQYEYVFRWRLPTDLPSSMHCKKRDNSTSFCEIRYTLTAYLEASSHSSVTRSSHPKRDPLPKSMVNLSIAARTSQQVIKSRRPIRAPLEDYPVTTCLFWNKGTIAMGWQVDSNVTCPGESVAVTVVGSNKSRNDVKYVSVKCVEKVQWKSVQGQRALQKIAQRTLCERHISVEDNSLWKPWQSSSHAGLLNGDDYNSRHRDALLAQLVLPSDARDSYQGQLVTVNHTLVVSVHTRGWATTSPESTLGILVVRQLPPPPTAPSLDSSTVTSSWTSTADDSLRNAQAIPMANAYIASCPVVEDPVEIPMAEAILIDDELQAAHVDQEYLHRSQSISPSAPDEQWDRDGRATNSYSRGYSDLARPDMDQLETLIRESPDSLPLLLEDDLWRVLVQNLTPRDFCQLCQAAPMDAQAGRVGKELAVCMGRRFESRYLLACLWGLPELRRYELLMTTSPLVTDFDANRSAIEQELSPRELSMMRNARG